MLLFLTQGKSPLKNRRRAPAVGATVTVLPSISHYSRLGAVSNRGERLIKLIPWESGKRTECSLSAPEPFFSLLFHFLLCPVSSLWHLPHILSLGCAMPGSSCLSCGVSIWLALRLMSAAGKRCHCFDCMTANGYSLWKLNLLHLDPNMQRRCR